MGYDKIDTMYDALVKDGAQIGTRQQFKKLMLAPGKEGYKNRLGFYNAMKQDGAQIGNSYEEFGRALGLHAVNPKKKVVNQNSQPQTAAQRAISQGYKQKASAPSSSTDYMQNWNLMHKRNDQMTPMEQAKASTMRSRMQQSQKQAIQQEQRRANPISQSRVTPNAQNFNETMQQLSTPQAKRARAVQQREDDARNLAEYEITDNKFTHNDGKIGAIYPEIDSTVEPSMKEADDLSWKQYQQDLRKAGNDAYLRNKAWKDLQDNRITNRQETLAKNLSAKLQEIYSQKGLQEHIIESADKLNMGVEEYVDKYVTPQMMQRAQSILGVKNIEEVMPKSATEYVARRLSDSILGTLSSGQDKSNDQRMREQEAMAIADGLEDMPTVKGYKGKEGYKSGVAARFVSTAANMAMDSPLLGMTGGAANMTVDLGKQVLMRGLAKVGLVKAGAKLTAQQLAFKVANMTMAQKIGSGLIEGTAKGALNLGGYSSITSALGQASTGNDTSLSALGHAALEGFEHGAKTGAMFGVSGAIMAPWVSKFGINGLETSRGQRILHGAQKFGATGLGIGVEAGTMMVADNITGDKDISVGTWLEDLVMVGAFKAGEPKNYAHIGSALYGLAHNTNNTFRVGKDNEGKWRSVDIHMTKDEQNELINSVSGKNLMDAFKKVDKSSLNSKTPLDKNITKQVYQDFMNDPNVSQSTKEKVNAAMGLFNTDRGRSYKSVNDAQNKQILEYTQDGTLLTRTSYKNSSERDAILYRQKIYRNNDELMSLVGLARLKDREILDEKDNVKPLAVRFLQEKGYDDSKDATDPQNATLVSQLRDTNSNLYSEWIKYADKYGVVGTADYDNVYWDESTLGAIKDSLGIEGAKHGLFEILAKDPMKRTDRENEVLKNIKNTLEAKLFPDGKPHEEQSVSQGESVASDNNLGTEQPNGQSVKQELNNLSNAEKELEALMRDNDIFSDNFEKLQKEGLTNPQIYDWMIQNGMTQEQLEPFAHYINANARVQGMQNATAQKIEEKVSSYVQDWAFHGTLNGQKAEGENALFVKDSDGRTLIVGSGDVAFDSTGRAKEDVGDMLVCLDPSTGEVAYVKADDVTLAGQQPREQFEAEYRQKLQQINSQPYNEAMQEQAMQDAGNPKKEVPSDSSKTTDTATSSLSGDTALSQSEGVGKDTENNSSVQENPIINDGKGGTDKMGNTLNSDGSIYTESVKLVSDITDEDFDAPSRSVELPPIPQNVSSAIGADGKPVIIKKNIFEKNAKNHPELDAEDSRTILTNALYNPNLVGQTQPVKRPSYKVAVQTGDKNSIVVLDVYNDKKQVEIVGWRLINEKGLAKMKRQAEREGGQFLILSPNDGSAAALSALPHGLSSGSKDTNNSSNGNGSETTLTFEDGTLVPIKKDSKGRPTPDYDKMTPEQAAEILTKQLGESAEPYVDAQIKKAEKEVKKAEKMKIDFNGEPNDVIEQQQVKTATIAAAKEQLEHAQNIKKAMTAKKVADTVAKPKEEEKVEGAHEAGSVAAEKFANSTRMKGNTVSKRLPGGEKISGHYEIVPAESLTPSHDPMNGYKKSDGFPTDKEGRTINDRDYENDKAAQQVTDQMAQNYNGQAITQVPTVSDEGIVYDGNGRTMAGQKAAKNRTDAEYIEDLLDNAQNYGFTREQIENSGIEHPRLVMVTDERLPYDTATFAKFNRNEKKAQNNTEQAVAKAKTLTPDEVGAIVADIEGNGSLEAFFNNSKAINDLIKTLQEKGVIGQNEVDGYMDGPERLSAQGKEFVKNLLLGSVFKPETIRMLGYEPALKNKAIAGIRAIMDNLKLGDYSLRDEIDHAIQLMYEAKKAKSKSVAEHMRTNDIYGSPRDRYTPIEQAIAQALDGSPSLFRDLIKEYNDVAKTEKGTGEAEMFGERLSPEEVAKAFLESSNVIKNNDIKLYGNEESRNREQEASNHDASNEEPAKEAGGTTGAEGEEPTESESQQRVDEALKSIATEITKQTGIEVVTDEKEAQKALDEAESNGIEVKKQAMLSGLTKAANAIKSWLKDGKRGKVFTIDLPISTQAMIKKVMGRDFDSHNITANGVAHAVKNHGENGNKLSENSIPLRNEDLELLPYIMTAPDYVKEGSTDVTGRRSIRFYKDLSNGYVVVAEKEYKNSPDDMETITMWAEKSDKATNAQQNAAPDTHVQNAILDIDAAKIRKDAEIAIENDVKLRKQKVYHGTGANFDAFDSSHAFEGEGSESFGHGVYVTSSEKIGADYAKRAKAKLVKYAGTDIRYPDGVKENPIKKRFYEDIVLSEDIEEAKKKAKEQILYEIKTEEGAYEFSMKNGNIEYAEGCAKNISDYKETYDFIDNIPDEYLYQRSSNRYDVDIPDDNGNNYLVWDKEYSSKEADTLLEKLFEAAQGNDKYLEAVSEFSNWLIDDEVRFKDFYNTVTGESIYRKLAQSFAENGEVYASELLSKAGITGMKYKAGSIHGNAKENDYNYVIYKDSDAKITGNTKFFRGKNGEVYGFTVGGKIYLDTKKMKPETPLHEYTHLWTEALRNSNPKEWENVKKLFDEVEGLKEEVQKLYPELKGDDLYEEMITTFSGREGAKKLEEVVRGLAKDEGKSVTDSVKTNGFIHKVREALKKYWKGVADMLHIHFTSAEEVADKVLVDWTKGVNPADIKEEAKADKLADVEKTAEKKPTTNPVETLKKAADSYHEEKLDAARKAYSEAKEGGNADEIKHAAGKLKALLNEKYKAQGMGFVQRQKEIAKEIGKAEAEKIDKPFNELDSEEREYVASQNPLTESEIRELTSEENKNFIEDAVDYINGNHGFAQKMAYLKIYDDVRNRHENAPDNSGAKDGTQLDATDTKGGEKLGLGTGRESGGIDGQLDRGTGNETPSREPERREGDKDNSTLSSGEPSDKQGEGNSSDMGAVPTRDSNAEGSGTTGKDRNEPQQGGRESGNRPAKPNEKRKPTAKQGTTWRGRTGDEIKKNVADKKAAALAAIAELKKRKFGKDGSGTLGMNAILTKEQMEYVPTVMNAVKEYGMAIIDEGIYKVKDWFNHIRDTFSDGLKDCGFTDQDIDDFVKEMWNSKMPMDGEVHTIAEWCSIYGNQQLKEKLGEELDVKRQKQMDAEPIEVKIGDRKNIEETLPFLLPQQQEDVLKAETQFFGKEHSDRDHAYGKGYMFTNGTGTGKTYTGLGIAKRLAKQGKGRILFVTPSQKKVSDWMKDGKNLGLDIRSLDSWAKERGTTATTESGDGMVITTYANMRQNKKLLETDWDAVIYDESHRIMENKKGAETTGSMQHYMVTNRDENHCFLRLQTINPHYQKMQNAADRFNELRQKEIKRIQKEYKQDHPSATMKDVINATHGKLPKDLNSFAPADAMTFPKLGKAYQDFTTAKQHYYNNVEPKLKEQAKNTWKNTKTIFLSATPFNTRENLDYAEGYIFKYPEDDGSRMSGRSRFYLDHFGAAYRYRYNRLEAKTDNPAAIAKQEIAFSDYLQNTLGTMSGRIIDSAYDYSRDFPTVAPDHADEFNNAVQEAIRGSVLSDAYRQTIGNYNYGSALFETMKVANIIQRMKDHLDAGRKIVVFHRRVETKEPLTPPFATMLSYANEMIKNMKPGKERNEAIKEVTEFREKHQDLLNWEQTLDYSMPREQIAKAFGKDNVLFFSGKESKGAKSKAVDTFNDDNSGKNIIVIQEASGKEGISLHDVTGNHQRVLITLGLPQSPITALQIEGRTYRIGNKSNAIFEYPILGLNSEMMLFGEKFNNQVSTTENLALGSQARNLRDSFAKGILEHSGIVPIDQQGVGGKEFDAPKQSDSDPYDDAVLDYYSNQKLNRNNREGVDYFPTPEPLGYKMVEWANMGEGDTALEPSAGHGAIARYVPKENEMTSIEPSQSLFTKLQLKAGGLGRKFLNNTFENYDIKNKHDVVVMNPPFGTAGATAIAHLDKAFKHLDEGGRVVAIIPRGSTDKKFDKWYEGQKNIAMRAEVDLPDIVFQQAGTSVRCRVVVLDKITDDALRSKAGYPEKVDLSGHYDKIEDFFEDLRDVKIPDRIVDTQLKAMKKARSLKNELKDIKGVQVNYIDKNGVSVFDKNTYRDYSINFPSIRHSKGWYAENYSKIYEAFDQQQKNSFNENSKAALDEMKKLACKLADMSEDEMQKYIADKKNGANNGGTHFRMELGKTFSDTKENFDGIRDRAIEEKGIVMPNLNKESVKVVPVEKSPFGDNIESSLSKAKTWAKENLVTTGKSELPTMRDGTPYTISKKAVEKYLSESAVKKSENLDVHLSVLPKLTDVIHESIEAEIHPDYNKGEDGTRSIENGYGDNVLVHRLYGAVELDGKTYRVKTTMQEFRGGEENKPHSYEVTKIELLSSPGERENPDRPPLVSPSNSKNELLEGSEKANESDSLPLSSATNNSISAAKLLNGVEKSYDSGKKLLDESKNLTEGETSFRNSDNSPVKVSDNAPVVVKRVAEVAKKVGGKVNMVNSAEEVTNPQAKKAIEEGKKITGWYDEKTGEVHLYMPNIHDSYTAEKTIWHEVVGHKGLRELFGEDRFRTFLNEVWNSLGKPENAELKKLVDEERRFNPFNIYDAIEEGLARFAEEGKGEAGFWRNLKNKVSDFLHEIGYRIAPNTKDVKYLLWLSKNLQKNPNDPYYKMRAEAVRYRLDHEDIPTVVERNGMIFDNDGKNHDYLLDLSHKDFEEATDGKVHFRTSPMTASKIEEYNRILGTKTYAFKESTVNHLQSLEEAMKLISGEKDVWKDIPSSFNPLQAANRIESMEEQICWKYDKFVAEPLDSAFNKLVSGMDGNDAMEQKRNAELYMIKKHGLERNREFFVRDSISEMDDKAKSDALRKDWKSTRNNLRNELDKGKINLKGYFDKLDEWICDNIDKSFEVGEHDYSGFHGMYGLKRKKDPYVDADVIDDVMSTESRLGKTATDFWKAKKNATDFVINMEYTNGFIDQDKQEYLKDMFNWYVPLRKFDETTAEDIYGYITEKGDPNSYIGSVISNAKGRTSLSDTNIMAQISAMAKSSIFNGGKNIVKQHFARFVSAYEGGRQKDRIFLEINPWAEKHTIDGKEVWVEVTPQIPENATQEQISNILQDFENDMQAKKASGDAKIINRRRDAGVRFQRAKDKSQHLVEVYIAGKKKTIFCQGNPRAAQAINGLLRDSGANNTFTKWSAKINRRCAQFNTSYNPDFFSSNLMRDLTFASANITKEGRAYTKQFCKEYYNNLKLLNGEDCYWKMFGKYRAGKLDMSNDRQRMFKEFMENGGQTGFVQFEKLEKLIKEYDNLVKNGVKDADGWFWRQIKSKGGFIESANEMFEGIARFSCYVTSRNTGRSIGRSIYDAKEVSTNFNKHGSGNAIYSLKTATDSKGDIKFRKTLGWFNSYMKNHTMFYNAGVQGASLLLRNSKQYAKTTGVAFGALPFALSFAVAALNNYFISKEDKNKRGGVIDPYAELPDYKRRGSICIYTGRGHFLTIPLGIELRAAYGIGDIAAGHSLFPNLKSDTPIGYDILGQVAQLVPASDFLGHHAPGDSFKDVVKDVALTVTPTVLKPEAELLANRDWTGRPIYRDKDYLDMAPQWKSAYDNTSGFYMTINKWANQATNGIDSSNPEMKGNSFLDTTTAPYAWQHIISGYFGGIGSTVSRIWNVGFNGIGGSIKEGIKNKSFEAAYDNWEKFDKNQIPIWRNFVYTSTEGHDMQRTKSKWYNYADELKQLDYNIKQLKTNTPDPVQNLKNSARKYNFGSTLEGKQLQIYDAASKYISKKRSNLKKATDPDTRKSIEEDINRKMQEAVSDLDKLQ